MPRVARKKSGTNFYHVMLRTINRQDLFLDHEDRQRFIDTLIRFKAKSGYEIYGYCLMTNHIHLLMQAVEEDIAVVMKRINVSYVYWYNNKYERAGHLFQDRYKSEAVENDAYFMVVLRYIHQNPLKAGLASKLSEYFWSSYNNYLQNNENLVNVEYVFNLFHQDKKEALKLFKTFMSQKNNDQCLDDFEIRRKNWSAEEVADLLYKVCETRDFKKISTFKKQKRDKVILDLRDRGLTIRKLAEITGLGRGVIERVTRR